MSACLRNPGWRWDLVDHLVVTRQQPDDTHDAIVHRMYSYAVEYDKLKGELSYGDPRFSNKLNELKSVDFAVSDAHTIYFNSGTVRFYLEALLLTDEPRDSVCNSFGITAEVLDMYCRTFYDIEPIVGRPLLLMHWLFGGTIAGSFNASDSDKTWKAYALFGGRDMLYSFWRVGKLDEATTAEFDKFVRGQSRRLAVRSSISLPVDKYTAPETLSRYNDTRRVEMEHARLEKDLGGRTDSDMTDSLRAMLTALKLTLHSSTGEVLGQNEIPDTRKLVRLLHVPDEYGTKVEKSDGDHRKQLAGDKK